MKRFVLKPEPLAAPAATTVAYEQALNQAQFRAAVAPPGKHLVIAGAGTGKTRTLVYRLAYLVETGVDPRQIILLTFTRRAAGEMMRRAASLAGGACERVKGGTYHSYCHELLRRHGGRVGLPASFTVLDQDDAQTVIHTVRSRHAKSAREQRFPSKRVLHDIFSLSRARQTSLATITAEKYPQFVDQLAEITAIAHDYGQYKTSHGLLDYDDLLHKVVHLMQNHEELRLRIASACRHVLVDEYQDANPIQAQLIDLLSSVHGNLMVVGDDAQSIYRFRGADVTQMLDFCYRHPVHVLHRLETNYRSRTPILSLANAILAEAPRQFQKELVAIRGDGERPYLVRAADQRTESQFIAQMVLQLRESGVPLSRIGVLFRSAFQAFDVEVELQSRQVPYVKYGGLKLTEAAHVKDILAVLRVAENPDDEVAWTRMLQLLDGVGPKTAAELVQLLGGQDARYKQAGLDSLSPRYRNQIKGLVALLKTLIRDDVTLLTQFEEVVTWYAPILKRLHPEDVERRQQDLDQLYPVITNYRSRADLLAALALDPIDKHLAGYEEVEEEEAPLVLSTIHSAKGLEFHTVFLLGASDGQLPSWRSIPSDAALDEERRLAYVAVTRAEDQLYISFPTTAFQRGEGDMITRPSRFFEPLSPKVLEPAMIEYASADDA